MSGPEPNAPDGTGPGADDDTRWSEARRSMARLDAAASEISRIWLAVSLAWSTAGILLLIALAILALNINAMRESFRWGLRTNDVLLQTELAFLFAVLAGVLSLTCGLAGLYLLRRERGEQRLRELELELMHTQRLAMMGETAAMLAHELAQPLTAAGNFLGSIGRLVVQAPEGALAKIGEMAERAAAQTRRAREIIAKLRDFIEKRESERSLESPATLIEDALMLLGTLSDTIKLETHVEPDLPDVLIDRVQLQQVLVNLMRNAIEAMQGCPRRELRLSAKASGSDTVQISLQDTGRGLSRDISSRLFEPFVTSKKDGMGVGLSICRTIVQSHNGRIWAESSSGGTVFHFTLPAMREQLAA